MHDKHRRRITLIQAFIKQLCKLHEAHMLQTSQNLAHVIANRQLLSRNLVAGIEFGTLQDTQPGLAQIIRIHFGRDRFHNQLGLLTETIGHPTPTEIPLVPERQIASGVLPYPIAPQEWRFRQSVDYSLTANWAVLDIASRNRENFLYNIYRMGKRAIDRGSAEVTRYAGHLRKAHDEAHHGPHDEARHDDPGRDAAAERRAPADPAPQPLSLLRNGWCAHRLAS